MMSLEEKVKRYLELGPDGMDTCGYSKGTGPHVSFRMEGGEHATLSLRPLALAYLARQEPQPYQCDGERVLAWIDDPHRAPPEHAFTAGLERQIAHRFQELLGGRSL